MFRKTILASTLSLLLTPGAAWALGVGGIRTESALNQPFAAEIDLVGVNPDELDAVKVTLASEAEFVKRGADRQHHLTKLSFKPQVSPRGKPVVRVTSTEAIREPYMNLLIEVAWPKGRLVREYTVLLDPPVTARRAPPAVERPAVGSLAVAARKDAPPVAAERIRAAAPVVQPPTRATTPPATGAGVFPLRYGPVKSGTGLWRVASKITPPGATVAQTAMALYRNNQGAFAQGDINRLRQGVVLQIPTSVELFALNGAKAEAEFRSAIAGKRVTAKPLTDVAAAVGEEQSRLKIAGAAKTGGTGEAGAVPAVSTSGGSSAGDIEQELLLVRETGESTRQETDELRTRVRELETNLTDIRSLLTLRNAELERLRGGTPAPATSGVVAGDAPLTMPAEGRAPVGKQAPGADVASGTPEPTKKPASGPQIGGVAPVVTEAKEGVGKAAPPAPQAAPSSGGAPAAAPPKAPEPARTTTVEPAHPVRPAGTAVTPAREEAEVGALGDLPLVGGLLADAPAPVLWTALVATPVLGVLAWLSIRRRRRIDEHPGALDLTDAPDRHNASGAAPSQGASEVAAGAEGEPKKASAFAGAAAPEGGAEGAEAISEADIYIAYGRYRDAQRLLREALVRAPRGVDLHYKLAETYVGSKDYGALAALLKEMEAAGMDRLRPDPWRLLAESAAQNPPGEPFAEPDRTAGGFGAGARSFGESSGKASADTLPVDDIEIVTEHLFSEPVGEGQGLTLDDAQRPGERMAAADLDLDFGELDFGKMSLPESADLIGVSSDLNLQSGDRDLDLAVTEPVQAMSGDLSVLGAFPTDMPPRSGRQTTSQTLSEFGSGLGGDSVDLFAPPSSGGLGSSLESALEPGLDTDWAPPPAPPQAPRPASDLGSKPESGRFDLGAIPQNSDSSDLLSSNWQMDGGLWDEVGTKLDLGRAYVEMSDLEAAQAILNEVIEEGNAEQQQEARGLLAQLKGR